MSTETRQPQPRQTRIWLKLLLTRGLGAARLQQLYDQFGSALEVDSAIQSGLCRLSSNSNYKQTDRQRLDQHLEWLQVDHNHLITIEDPDYPELLRGIAGAPAALFVVGNRESLWQPQIAMVGSRNPSRNGLDIATEMAGTIAEAGLTITSGLAHGIDATVHRGALAATGRTIAVMGTGADRIYPARHRQLAQEIVDSGGALITEFVLGTEPRPGHFPARNRIISGLSIATLVVEAGLRSGSLITARLAAEQGREVLAVPGSVRNATSRGCHLLIRDGARLVETAEQLLEDIATSAGQLAGQLVNNGQTIESAAAQFDEQLRRPIVDKQSAGIQQPVTSQALDDDQKMLLGFMDVTPISVDMLIDRLPADNGLTIEQISSMLLLLELDGLIANEGSGWIKVG